MEEILASIRRIIADDDASKSPSKAENPMPPPPTPMAPPRPAPSRPVAAAPPPPVEPVMQQDDLDAMLGEVDKPAENSDADVLDLTEAMAAETPMPEPVPVPSMPELQSESAPTPRPLISSSTSAAVDSAFNTLAHTVLVQNARTLEDLVREMLRPLLKSWLDDNLPGMVERLVRAEIERVSRGRS
jgi:cell pole-organizing protein PopZ